MSYLKIENLNFFYSRRRQVLHDINLSFDQHNTTAIIGGSGSGKSTLLRTFNRIYELHGNCFVSGKIFFDGQDILKKTTDLNVLRRRIGMVFQKPTPFPMSVRDNIIFPLKTIGKFSKEELNHKVEKTLKSCALWDEVKHMLKKSAYSLSGGQQQRLCIARLLSMKPEVLLLDEPTSSLDPLSTLRLEKLITKLAKNYTVILVTHNLKQAQRISDTTIFIKEGVVIEKNTTKELFSNPQHDLTKEYIKNA